MAKGVNRKLFNQAQRYMPGGVNSPVRACKTVGGEPVFMKSGVGARMYSEGGDEFIDYCLSWGALILGHAHPDVVRIVTDTAKNGTSFGAATKREIELAKVIVSAVPSIERVRLTNSGTEAVMGAIRLARAFTGRDKVVKFTGSYHGHADYLLDCAGVPRDFTRHTLVCPYNDAAAVEKTVRRRRKDIAAIIVEPVAANMGVVPPRDGFLPALRKLADAHGIVLIFDEVITGFRLAYGGAQEFFKVTPDMTCLGKIIGGGLPMGAFGGRNDIMRLLAPEGEVYQAGTFSGNPLCVSAGLAALKILADDNPYKKLEKLTRVLCGGMNQKARDRGLDIKINTVGSMFTLFLSGKDVSDYAAAGRQDFDAFKRFYHGLLREGIYFSPSGLEANFVSAAHTAEDIETTVKAAAEAFGRM